MEVVGAPPRLRRLAAGFHRATIALRQRDDFLKLLFREGEPALELRIEPRLEVEIERRVQQRARGCNPQSILPARLRGPRHQRTPRLETCPPQVPAANHPRPQPSTLPPIPQH